MDRVVFKINGELHSVGAEVSSEVTLLDYIRNYAELRGTKYMCREAGCGACIISVSRAHGEPPEAVNSCMVSITSCQDWEITTIEEVGNRLKGYNILQRTLANCNGTQCGHCTPGWIMAMYSLLHTTPNLTMLDVERSFGSNVCRCTGYRPILDAFKQFAIDYPHQTLSDIEDLKICDKTKNKCNKNCKFKTKCKKTDEEDDWYVVKEEEVNKFQVKEIYLKDDKKWFRVYTVKDVFDVLNKEGYDSYMLVAGNTAKGAYPILEYPRILIDISNVPELKGHFLDQNLVVGANTTLTEALQLFYNMASQEFFQYLIRFYEHLLLVAHVAVRNIGTLAGNLMIKHQHIEFPSDVFLLLETVGAQLTLVHSTGTKHQVTMQQFLQTDMTQMIILNVMLPPLASNCKLVTYKIMPRSQNAHAIVNAGFLYQLNNDIVQSVRIVYGGISPTFIRAGLTEAVLTGNKLFTNETLATALHSLNSEVLAVEMPPEPSVVYRKQLAVNLFYKGLLAISPPFKMPQRYSSAAVELHESRPVSKGLQFFETNKAIWPLNKPMPKLEALIQCSGEAPFTEDTPSLPHEVFAAFVLSTVPKGNIVSIHPKRALAEQGVLAFYTAEDIPGENSFMPGNSATDITFEVVLSNGTIDYYNQPIGIIVAESRAIADRAAKLVDVVYSNVTKPEIDIRVTKHDPKKTFLFAERPASHKGIDVVKVIKGDETIYGQYHFTMETLVCVTKPIEDGLEVNAATQWLDVVQEMVSRALNLQQNKIDVKVRRLGGGYGIKVSRVTQTAVACSLVTYKLNRPCRFIQSLTTNTRAIGKRLPCSFDFEAGVNSAGVIQYLNVNVYEDNGYKVNETLARLGLEVYNNCYDSKTWDYRCFNGTTDTAKNTWCRSPGTLENITMTETIMERISYELSLDPLQVRLANLDTTHQVLKDMANTLVQKSDYYKRRQEVDSFNYQNRWKKRGLRFSFLRWRSSFPGYYDANLAVYHGDGSVALTHGGIEMGQGINTKAAQLCAYLLGIPVEKVQIKCNDTTISPNAFNTAGSFTSQFILVNTRRCCEEILRRLEPIRRQLLNPTWEQVIAAAFKAGVDLQAHGFAGADSSNDYDIYGVTLAEVEIDVLTGEHEIRRVDLLQDVGQSVSPEIDIGQVEGAFIMGLGYWTSEHLVYNQLTGELLTDRTWNYYVPLARDIPQDFRVYFKKKSYSTEVFFGSKMTGEPSLCMAIAVPFAIREAITAARLEYGIPATSWFTIDGPYTVEQICLASATNIAEFKFV